MSNDKTPNYQKEIYALQDTDGDLIGIDLNSGGYSWTPDTLNGVWFSSSPDRLRDYPPKGRYKLVRVSVALSDVSE